MVAIVLCGEGLGLAGSALLGQSPSLPAILGVSLGVAVIIGGLGAVLLDWMVLDRLRRLGAEVADLRRQAVAGQEATVLLASRSEQLRRLRHDMRGALSPALLVADRLLSNADPSVRRSGQIMVRTVERATGLLAEPGITPEDQL